MRIKYCFLTAAALCLLFPISARAQWLYVTRFPGNCAVDFDSHILSGPYDVVLHAPDHGSATGVYFRLYVDGLGDEDDVVVTPQSGVTFVGDIRNGMFVTFSPRTLWHEPLLSLSFVDNAPPSPLFGSWIFASVRDAVLTVPGGTLPLENMDAVRIHCNGSGTVSFQAPASPEVAIGETTVVDFKGISVSDYYGPGPTNLVASDVGGWVVSLSPNALWNGACAVCPWLWETLSLTVTVPQDTEPGIMSLVTISEGGFPLKTFFLTAVATTAVQSKTWGAIKALYR